MRNRIILEIVVWKKVSKSKIEEMGAKHAVFANRRVDVASVLET